MLVGAFTETPLIAEQLGYVVPLPLSLRSYECREARLESGLEVIGKCVGLREAHTNLGG